MKAFTLGGVVAAVVLLASAGPAQAQFIVGPSYGGTYITPGGSVINKRVVVNPYTGGSVINKQIITPGYRYSNFGNPVFGTGFVNPGFNTFGNPYGFNRGFGNPYHFGGFNNGFNNFGNFNRGRGFGVSIGFVIR
jgi:hypothetical protein